MTQLPPELERRYLVGFDTDDCVQHRVDVLVIGSGIAGLTAAIAAAPDRSVALVTKARLAETNTWYAQGGIAGAVGEADSVELHLADTLVVGAGLCDEAVVRAVVQEAPEALADLQALGMRFDVAEGGEVALAREGGHSLPRVLHSGDTTGAAVQDALTASLLARSSVRAYEQRFLVDLLTTDGRCVGALVLDELTGGLEVFWADAIVLATGGAGQMYRVTTNPLIACGDGVAAAWRAGAEVADLEFVQFHPTALDHEAAPRFLITEALRGEGAHLLDCDGRRFMLDVHPLAELAPRDVVSREIERVMAECGQTSVHLDARHLGEAYLKARFPTIWQACADAGYDLATDLVPVAPAAHYLVGGVRVNIDGRTSVEGLYASGEVSCSGLHGANRLASNSLLEGLVFSRRIVRALECTDTGPAPSRIVTGPSAQHTVGERVGGAETPPDRFDAGSWGSAEGRLGNDQVRELVARVRATMQRHVGMSRSDEGLAEAIRDLAGAADELAVDAGSTDSMEAANLVTVAALTASAARARRESRGCHYRLDFGERDDAHWRGRIVARRGAAPAFVPLDSGA